MVYTLTLTADEHKALAWIADRYTSAEVLYDGLDATDDNDQDWGGNFTIAEHVVWEYMEALPEDNGNPGQIVPPCVGGTLADKLVRLWESVV
jgi:hypothetical protein